MSLDESFLDKPRCLPPDKQCEAIDFVEYLHKRSSAKDPKCSFKGIWADLGLDVSEEDIAQARSEMWGNFPDMPDRIIGATAIHLGLPLVTCDGNLSTSAVQTIW